MSPNKLLSGKLVMKKAGMEDLPRSIFRACLYHLYLHSHLTRHFQIYRLRIGFPVNSSVSRAASRAASHHQSAGSVSHETASHPRLDLYLGGPSGTIRPTSENFLG